MDWQVQYCEDGYIGKVNLHAQCNPPQNSNDIHYRGGKINPKVYMEAQKISNNQGYTKVSQFLISNYTTEP
jgi:hypothetical protein